MKKHKRYIVFSFGSYYPSGGIHDCIGSFDSVEECEEAIKKERETWNQIYDRVEGVLVLDD